VNVLDVSPRVCNPPRRGAAVRAHHLLRFLSERHAVRQLSVSRFARGWEGARGELEVTPGYRELRWRPAAALLGELASRAWPGAPLLAGSVLRLAPPPQLSAWLAWADVALVEFPWPYGACRARAGGTPLVLASHNLERAKFPSWADAVGARLTRRPWLRWVERLEREAAEGADLVLAVSPDEAEGFATHYGVEPGRILLVPNGADTQRIRPVGRSARAAARRALGLPERPTAVFLATTAPANRAGLRWVEALAAATDAVTFLVIGRVSPARRAGSLVATGEVDDFAPWLAAADLGLCPIEHGAGTKIKLVETMAAGLANVAFPAAARGLAVRDGEHLVLAKPEPGALLAAVRALAADLDEADRIGRAARALVERDYDWARIAARLGDELERRFGARAGPR
jgi:glycosyltransferase involved in cell wall biosynthesis